MSSIALLGAGSPVTGDASGRSPLRSPTPTKRITALAVLGLLVTVVLADSVAHRAGVYWSQVDVVFQAPESTLFPNTLLVESEALITTAGVVAKTVDPSSGARVVSDSVTLVGEGIRNGWSVHLPDTGGQWATNFSRPVLDVQAVSDSPARVSATISTLESRIDNVLARLQDDQNVAAVNRITASPNPPTPPMYYQSGSRTRALAATVLIGLIATFAVCRALDGRIRRGSRRRRKSPAAS
jgi:hypothetical protein